MQFKGQPLTVDAIRRFLGTPTVQALVEASVDENLQFVRYLVDPRKADGLRQTFTLGIEGDSRIRQLELRNGVLIISPVTSPGSRHVDLTRQELADLVLGKSVSVKGGAPLVELDRALDRSRMLPPTKRAPALLDAKGNAHYNHGLEH